MKVYKPTEGKGFAWGVGLLVFCVIIIALPIVMTSGGKGPGWSFTAIMSLMLLLVIGVIGYFTWAAKNMEYRIDGDELIIRWAFNQKRIPLKSIKGIQKVIGTSSMKVAGASWPGFHWGSFTSPFGRGSVNLYATRLWGDIIVIRTPWEDIGITPGVSEEFLNDLQKLVPELAEGKLPDPSEEEQLKAFAPWRNKVFLGMVVVSVVITVGTALFLFSSIPGLPEKIPMHYNMAGEIDRYGSPGEVWLPFGIGAVTNIFVIGLSMTVARNNKMSAYMMGAVSIFLSLIFCMIAISMVVSA